MKVNRGFVFGIANPHCAEFASQRLMSFTIASANVDFRSTCARKLNTHMTRSAKSVQAKPRTFPFISTESRQPQASVADDTGAEKWRSLNIVKVVWQMVSESGRSGGVFCITTIYGPSREQGFFAK